MSTLPEDVAEDVAEARRATRDLTAAVDRLARSHPDTIDLRRLAEDVARVRVDLDLLAGVDPTLPPFTGVGRGGHDTEYDPHQFGDGA
jgi:hypothetical protein